MPVTTSICFRQSMESGWKDWQFTRMKRSQNHQTVKHQIKDYVIIKQATYSKFCLAFLKALVLCAKLMPKIRQAKTKLTSTLQQLIMFLKVYHLFSWLPFFL
jgi:hypothetical protein